jgi:hypothetical protein
LFNRKTKRSLSFCIVVFGVLVISACQEPNYQNEKVAERKVQFSASNEESNLSEYIIVLAENVSIEKAISNLHKYDARVIKDLKRGRYLIALKIDPGIEQLKKDVLGSKDINHIQPNFIYTIQ